MLFFILILIIAAAAALARQIRIVPHQMTYVIERFGKYYDTWEDGLHVKMPIADRIVKKVSKKERVYDFPPQDVITEGQSWMLPDLSVQRKTTNGPI